MANFISATTSYISNDGLNKTNQLIPVFGGYTASPLDSILITVATASGTASIGLPYSAQAGQGKKISICAVGNFGTSLSPQSGDTLNGTASATIVTLNHGVTVVADGFHGWYQI